MGKNKAQAPTLPRIRYMSCFDLTHAPVATAARAAATGLVSIVYEHGVRFERDCSKPDPKMVLCVFKLLPSSIHTTSYVYEVYVNIIRSPLSRRVGFRSYTPHIVARTCMFRRERATMSYVHELCSCFPGLSYTLVGNSSSAHVFKA